MAIGAETLGGFTRPTDGPDDPEAGMARPRHPGTCPPDEGMPLSTALLTVA